MLATQMPDTPPEAKDVKQVKQQSVSLRARTLSPALHLNASMCIFHCFTFTFSLKLQLCFRRWSMRVSAEP